MSLPSSPSASDSSTTVQNNALMTIIMQEIKELGGWMAFDRYMEMALYYPGLGYYSSGSTKFGLMPGSGSDFVTSPELSPLFGQCLAKQVKQGLEQTKTKAVWEFGAGSGALAKQLLGQRDASVHYHIIELSADLQFRQAETLKDYTSRVTWHQQLPEAMEGIVVGNEVLDAMPVKLLQRLGGKWFERGVSIYKDELNFADIETHLRPPVDITGQHDYLTELPLQGIAFIRTLAHHLKKGAAFFIDYGFPESEYYHAQRQMGTVVCHRAHQVDMNPLVDPGLKDITAHVDFTAMALAWQNAGDEMTPPKELGTLGYCNQGRFLFNCDIADYLSQASVQEQNASLKLLQEHEMGELFKVMGLYVDQAWDACGFMQGDKSHTL